MIVAVYQPLPHDPTSGKILWTTEASPLALQASALPWVEVSEVKDYGATHEVVAGALTLLAPQP